MSKKEKKEKGKGSQTPIAPVQEDIALAKEEETLEESSIIKEEIEMKEDAVKFKEKDKELHKKIMEISTFIEKLEAKNQANTELRKVTNERISRLSEKIGEIKELFNVVSSEKKDLEIKISEQSAIVKKITPDHIFAVINKNKQTIAEFQRLHCLHLF